MVHRRHRHHGVPRRTIAGIARSTHDIDKHHCAISRISYLVVHVLNDLLQYRGRYFRELYLPLPFNEVICETNSAGPAESAALFVAGVHPIAKQARATTVRVRLQGLQAFETTPGA